MIINSKACRTWTDPNAMQVDAVHVNINKERQIGGSGSRLDNSKKGVKGSKDKSKKGGKGKGEMRKRTASLKVNAGTT